MFCATRPGKDRCNATEYKQHLINIIEFFYLPVSFHSTIDTPAHNLEYCD